MTAATRQIVFINAAHLLTHYSLLILATAVLAIAVEERETFGSEYGPILALGTGMFVTYGLGALPVGWLAERWGRREMMVAFFLGTGLSLTACGFTTSPLALGIALAIMGCFAAIYHPIGTAILVEVSGERVGRAMGINGVFGNLGVALAPAVTAAIAATVGWRWAFLLPGLLCVGLGLLYLREPPFDTRQSSERGATFPLIPRQLVRRAVVVLLSIATVSGLVFNTFTLVVPKLMEERLAARPDLLPLIGLLAFKVVICGGIAQIVIGRMVDRRTLKRVFLPLSLGLVPGLTALAFLEGWMVLPVAGLVAACVFGQVTVNETMAARYVAPALRAKVYAVRFTVGFLGAALASPLIAFLHERTASLSAVMVVLAVVATVTLICAFIFPDRQEELKPELWSQQAIR